MLKRLSCCSMSERDLNCKIMWGMTCKSLFSQRYMEVILVLHVDRHEHLNGESKRKKAQNHYPQMKTLPIIILREQITFCSVSAILKWKTTHQTWETDDSSKTVDAYQFATAVKFSETKVLIYSQRSQLIILAVTMMAVIVECQLFQTKIRSDYLDFVNSYGQDGESVTLFVVSFNEYI